MFCKNCGTQIKDGAAFCTNCGMKIAPVGQSDAGVVTKSVPPVAPDKEVYYEPSVAAKKSLQTPIIIAAVLIVAVIGCLVAVFVLRNRDTDEDVVSHDISSEKKDFEDESSDEPEEEEEPSEEVEDESPQESQIIDEPVEEVSQYILPNSDSEYLTHEDLAGLTKEECRLARNELYARHGRRFDDEGLQNYFDQKDWYTGYIDPADFSDSVLNDFEVANRDLIVQYEEEMGYR